MSQIAAMDSLDTQRLRQDFPILQRTIRHQPLIYLDNAASSQKPTQVLEAMSRFYRQHYANVHRGLHTLSNEATEAYEGARRRTAAFLNARSDKEIIFTRGTTESINLVASTWGRSQLKPGDVILLTEMEHHSNLVPWQLLAQDIGVRLRFIPVTGCDGRLDLSQLDALLADGVRLLAFTHISNTLGTINPAAELCRRAKDAGVVTLIDAAQSAGHRPLDVQQLACDFLAFSGHKMCGPTGIGVLYGRRELLDSMPPYQGGGEMIESVTYQSSRFKSPPWRFEAGTPPIAEAVGLAAAMDYLDQIDRQMIADHDAELGRLAWEKLSVLPGIRLLGPGPERAGLITFAMDSVHAHDVVTLANRKGIALRGGHHCNQPLMHKLGFTSTTRASFYFYNTPEEIDSLVRALHDTLEFFGHGT